MQLTVDLPHKSFSNQSLVNEQLSNEILKEIEEMEQGHADPIDAEQAHRPVPEGYTELADCVTG